MKSMPLPFRLIYDLLISSLDPKKCIYAGGYPSTGWPLTDASTIAAQSPFHAADITNSNRTISESLSLNISSNNAPLFQPQQLLASAGSTSPILSSTQLLGEITAVSGNIVELETQIQALLIGLRIEHSELKKELVIQLEGGAKVCIHFIAFLSAYELGSRNLLNLLGK
jgi:hypothetical protein